jgi:predicted RNase H-like HicB family nuclease
MIKLPYSLVIEATDEPDFFAFYSPELEGFSGVGHSVEDCLYRARWGMKEHVELLAEQGLPVPPANPDPVVTLRNEKKGAGGRAAADRQGLPPGDPGACKDHRP